MADSSTPDIAAKSPEQNLDKMEKPVGKKHPLNSEWTLWYFLKDNKTRWEDSQKEVASFGTIEDFWGLFNNITRGSAINPGCDYSLFRKGINPMWEDPQNKNGGKWTYNSPVRNRRGDLDDMFIDLMLMLIGEAGGEVSDDCNGMVLSIRPRGDRLALWTRTTAEDGKIRAAGNMMKEYLRLPSNQLDFTRHADCSDNKRPKNYMSL